MHNYDDMSYVCNGYNNKKSLHGIISNIDKNPELWKYNKLKNKYWFVHKQKVDNYIAVYNKYSIKYDKKHSQKDVIGNKWFVALVLYISTLFCTIFKMMTFKVSRRVATSVCNGCETVLIGTPKVHPS